MATKSLDRQLDLSKMLRLIAIRIGRERGLDLRVDDAFDIMNQARLIVVHLHIDGRRLSLCIGDGSHQDEASIERDLLLALDRALIKVAARRTATAITAMRNPSLLRALQAIQAIR